MARIQSVIPYLTDAHERWKRRHLHWAVNKLAAAN